MCKNSKDYCPIFGHSGNLGSVMMHSDIISKMVCDKEKALMSDEYTI